MKILIILIGFLLILNLFGIGNKFLKRAKVVAPAVSLVLLLILVSLMLPVYTIGNFSFTIAGFVIGLILSSIFLFQIKNKKYFARFFISFLIVVFVMQLFFILVENLNLENSLMLAWASVVLALTPVVLWLCKFPKQTFSALFFGVNFAQIIHGAIISKPIFLGDINVLFAFVCASVFMLIVYNIAYLIRRQKRVKAFMAG